MAAALIAGAGIGGLTAALSLARAGWQVRLFEQASELQEVGAGLQLSPNATSILRHLGVLARVGETALAPRAIRIRRAQDAETLALLPLEDAEARWGAPYLLAHRADLQRALVSAVTETPGVALATGTAVTDFTSEGSRVTVCLGNGNEVAGDLLICADGARSSLREKVAGPCKVPQGPRRTAWRSLLAAGSVASTWLAPEANLWLGRGAHVVHYPLRGGTVVNLVAVLDEDPGRTPDADDWSQPGDPAFVARRFAAWAKPVRDLLSAAPAWRVWRLVERDPLVRWTYGRVALLGDAAHPVLPFLAQGAAQAIEDAAASSEVLARGTDVPEALAAYQAARRPRADRVQRESRRQGTIYHLGGPPAFARDLAIRALGGERLLERYDWLYRASERSLAACE